MVKYNALLIESGNFAWALISFSVFTIAIWVKAKNGLKHESSEALCALAWMTLGSGVNHSWFALSRHLAEDGDKWNALMFDWRWAMVQTTLLFYGWGAGSLLQSIVKFSNTVKVGLIAGAYVVAFTAGIF
jgi:hypothetical protein